MYFFTQVRLIGCLKGLVRLQQIIRFVDESNLYTPWILFIWLDMIFLKSR